VLPVASLNLSVQPVEIVNTLPAPILLSFTYITDLSAGADGSVTVKEPLEISQDTNSQGFAV
jgi:hypothetical protein